MKNSKVPEEINFEITDELIDQIVEGVIAKLAERGIEVN
jgi:hypothetical protein